MNQKRYQILIISLVMLLCVSGCSCTRKKKNKQTPKPTQSMTKVLDDQKVETLNITGFNITYKDGISTVVANVKNESNQDLDLDTIGIALYDKDHKLLVETSANIGDSIKAGETTSFTSYITMDLRNATKIEYKVNK